MDMNIKDNQDLSLLDDQGKKGFWNMVLGQIKILHPVKIYPYIKEGQFISADNEEIVIGFPKIYNFHRSRLEDVTIKEEVERIVENVGSCKISVAFVTIGGNGVDGEIIREPQVQFIPETPDQLSVKTDATSNVVNPTGCLAGDDERRLREKVMQDERLRKVLEVFEGKLVRVKKS